MYVCDESVCMCVMLTVMVCAHHSDVQDFREESNAEMKLRFEVYNQSSGNDSMGETVLHFRDHPDLQNVTSKWCELFLPLRRGNRERGELHLGVRCELVDDKHGNRFAKSAEEKQKDLQARKEVPFIDPAKCTVSGEGLWDGIRVDRQTFFRVMPHNQFEEPYAGKEGEDRWRIELITPTNERIPIKYDTVTEGRSVVLQCSYEPVMPGEHKVSVSINYKQIKGSPFPVFVHPVTDGAKCVVFGEELQQNFVHRVDEPVTFHVQARDASGLDITEGDDQIVVNIMGPVRGEPVVATVSDNNDGTHTVRFTPDRAGTYVLGIKCNGHFISDSPLSIKVDPCTHASQCLIDGAEDIVAMGQPSSFVIEARDKFGERRQRGGDCFVVSVLDEDGKEEPGFVADKDNGFYLVTFIPKRSGEHRVLVTLKKAVVLDHRIKVIRRVENALDYWPSGVILSGASFASVAENGHVEFDIISSESTVTEGGANMTISATNLEQSDAIIDASIIDNGNGSYTGRIAAHSAGQYHVHVKLNDEHIRNSPFTIWLHDGVDIAKTNARGPGIQKAYIDTSTVFFIQPRDSSGRSCGDISNLQFDISMTKDAQGTLPLDNGLQPKVSEVIHLAPLGRYRVLYTPQVIGTYYLHVLCEGRSIADSPYKITVRDQTWAPCATRSRVIQFASKCTICEPHNFSVRLYNNKGRSMLNGGDQVECTIHRIDQNSSGEDFDTLTALANVRDLHNGTYAVQWTPVAIGEYAIHITVRGESISDDPFKVTVMQPPSHSTPSVVERSFMIETFDDNGIPLDDEQAEETAVTVRFLERSSLPDAQCEESSQGTAEFRSTYNALTSVRHVGGGKYQCRFITSSPGMYDMLVSINNKQVLLDRRYRLEI